MPHNVRIRDIWEGASAPQPDELDRFDQGRFESVNGDLGGAWAPAEQVVIGGKGLRARYVFGVADADIVDSDLFASSATVIRIPPTLTADRAYTLSATGVQVGDLLTIFVDPACLYLATIKDQDGVILTRLGNAVSGPGAYDGQFASFINLGGWQLLHSRRYTMRSETFYGGDTWVCPAGVTEVRLRGYGGGGGGAGGRTGEGAVGEYPRGGGGGSGALASEVAYSVTPGTTYAIIGGAGGDGGTPYNDGAPGETIRIESAPHVDTVAFFGGQPGMVTFLTVDDENMSRGGARNPFNNGSISYRVAQGGVGDGGWGGDQNVISSPGAASGQYPGGIAGVVVGGIVGGYVPGGGGGGGGGGAGGGGASGGAGGIASSSGIGGDGAPGSSAPAFSGGGGGGGGGGGCGSGGGGTGGSGGNGGSGAITITYVR